MSQKQYFNLLNSKLKTLDCCDSKFTLRAYLNHQVTSHGLIAKEKRCPWCLKHTWIKMDYSHLVPCARNRVEIYDRRRFLKENLNVKPTSEEKKASHLRSRRYKQSLYSHSWTTSCMECDERFNPPLGFLEHSHTTNLKMKCVWCRSDDHSPSRECMERISTCMLTRKPNRISNMLKNTRNLVHRLFVLNTATPFEFKVVQQFETPDASRLETIMHRMFASKRFKGEFFELNDDDFVKMVECAKDFK